MLVLSTLHVHETIQRADTECVHDHCGGHLTQIKTELHDCVLCQFLTLPMLTAAVMAVTVYIHVCRKYHAQPLCGYYAACCGITFRRGPPSA